MVDYNFLERIDALKGFDIPCIEGVHITLKVNQDIVSGELLRTNKDGSFYLHEDDMVHFVNTEDNGCFSVRSISEENFDYLLDIVETKVVKYSVDSVSHRSDPLYKKIDKMYICEAVYGFTGFLWYKICKKRHWFNSPIRIDIPDDISSKNKAEINLYRDKLVFDEYKKIIDERDINEL